MIAEFDFAVARDFGTALLLGGLLGIEREKRNAREGFGIAGLRSFVMLAMVGAVAGFLARELASPWLLGTAVLAVAGVVVAGYFASARVRPEQIGLTTEFAALVTCLLGALVTTGHRELAIGLGVVTAALLAYKQPLHALVGRLHWDEVLVGLRLLLATFIVLPLLPDQAIDPWGALNPYKLWLLVLLISALSLLGYVATRWLGTARGTVVAAAAGGLVSSTAVTLGLVAQARERPAEARQLGGGILVAWGVMFARVLVAAGVLCPPLVARLAVPFAAMAVVSLGLGLLAQRRRVVATAEGATVELRNPFSLWAAGKFALLFAAVQLLLRWGQEWWPGQGALVVAAVAGLTDVDAITLSMAEQASVAADRIGLAVSAITIAAASNTLVKAAWAVALGPRAWRWPMCLATALVLAVGGLGALLA